MTQSYPPRWLATALLALIASVCFAGGPNEPSDATPGRLSIDRLYRLPWVTGTKPVAPHWSPDSEQLAFLWNDDGTNFRDVWLTDAHGATPKRLTRLPRPPTPANPGADVEQLQLVARAETDPGVTSLEWSSDGRTLLFTAHGQLYALRPGEEPSRIEAAGAAVQELAAAPAGNRAAYLSGADLYVLRVDVSPAVATRVYAPGRTGVYVEAFYWSPDGSRLAIIEADDTRVPKRGIPNYLAAETALVDVKRPFPGEPSESRRLGVVAIDGGDVRWAAAGPNPLDEFSSVAWSPDGRSLLVDRNDLYIKDRRLMIVDAATGASRLLLRESDPHNVTAEWWADWAPDGRGVYFLSDRDNDYHVYYQPLAGGEPRRVTRGPWAVFSATVSTGAKALFVVTNEGRPEERHVYRVPLRGGPPVRLTASPGTHQPVPSPDGRVIADLFSSDLEPPELYVQPTDAKARTRVTHSPLPEFSQYRWVAARYVEFKNIHDGTTLHARLTLPLDFDPRRKYPAILGSVYSNTVHNQWGGRIYHPTWGIDQYLAQQGYVIMNVDISGSSGHGKVFRQRIREDYGGVDVEDLYSGVRYLVSQGFVDPARVGIWGSSYGGLLTTMSLFKHPGVYKAGVAGAPATSLFHAETGEMRTMMAPEDHAEQYARSSAFLQSGGLADHLMIIHGMKDDVVLFKDSVTLTQRLILQGHDVDLVILPDSPHGWDTEGLAQTRFAFHKLADCFKSQLGEGPTSN